MMIIERYVAHSPDPLSAGEHTINVVTDIEGPGKSGVAKLLIDGQAVCEAKLKRTVPAAFTATESFDVGADLGSPVSLEYAERRPFEFNGKIESVQITLR